MRPIDELRAIRNVLDKEELYVDANTPFSPSLVDKVKALVRDYKDAEQQLVLLRKQQRTGGLVQ